MITVTNIDRNGKVIKDLSEVTINLAEFPVIVEALANSNKKEDTAA